MSQAAAILAFDSCPNNACGSYGYLLLTIAVSWGAPLLQLVSSSAAIVVSIRLALIDMSERGFD